MGHRFRTRPFSRIERRAARQLRRGRASGPASSLCPCAHSPRSRRPAVVASSGAYHRERPDLIILAVTSQVPAVPTVGEAAIEKWKDAGLLKPSVLKPLLATSRRGSSCESSGGSRTRTGRRCRACSTKSSGGDRRALRFRIGHSLQLLSRIPVRRRALDTGAVPRHSLVDPPRSPLSVADPLVLIRHPELETARWTDLIGSSSCSR